MGKLKTLVWASGVLLAAAFLSSCGQMIPILSTDTELTLGKDQKWSMEYVAVLPGEAGVLAQQYQATLDQMVLEMRTKGITASWELLPNQSGEATISYRVNFSGSGFAILNQEVFSDPYALVPDPAEKDQIRFTFDPRFSLFSQGQHNTFTLKSSKILATNGSRLNDETAQWLNPNTVMTATVSTAADLAWLWISLLGVGGTGFVVAGFGVMRKPAPRKQTVEPANIIAPPEGSASEPVRTKYCPQCGIQNPFEAGFCIRCGSKLP